LLSYVTGRPQNSSIFGRDPSGKKKGGAWRLGSVPDPEAILRDLTELYAQGMEEPLLFLPKCSEALFLNPDDVSKAQREWLGNPGIKMPGEGDHPAVRLVLGSQVGFGEATAGDVVEPSSPELGFRPLANRIFGPLWAQLQEATL
jgi:exonuclease V gamma subunit